MGMTQINLALSEILHQYVQNRVAHGGFDTPSDFVCSLIRRERDERIAALEAEMLEALAGPSVQLTREEVVSGHLIDILKTRFRQTV